jgi:rhomboid protease GluP
VLYLVSGVAGSLASLAWHPHIVSAGASGAIFGVFGALFGFILFRRDSIPAKVLKQLQSNTGSMIAINLLYSLSAQIDMAAHVGGLVAGLACGLALSQPVTSAARRGRIWRNALVAVVGAAALALATRWVPVEKLRVLGVIQESGQVEETVNRIYLRAGHDWENRRISNEQYAQIIDRDILPPWRSVIEQVSAVEKGSRKFTNTLHKLLQYMQAKQQGWELRVAALHGNAPARQIAADEADQRAAILGKEVRAAIEELVPAQPEGQP